MRKLRVDIVAVGAHERRGLQGGSWMWDLIALAQQAFCEVDIGAFTEVVGARHEAQSEQGDSIARPGDDAIDGFFDRQPIARKCA